MRRYLLFGVAALMLAAFSHSTAAECDRIYWMDDQGGACLSCSKGTPPWGMPSYHAHRVRYLVLCQACSVRCQTQVSGVPGDQNSCPLEAAADSIRDALVYGISRPAHSDGYAQLERDAPELALVLLSFGISNDSAPPFDMRNHTSRSDFYPTTEFVVRARTDELVDSDVDRYTRKLPQGQRMEVTARTDLLQGGRAALTLTSTIVDARTNEIVEFLNEYLLLLDDVGSRVGIASVDGADARVFTISNISAIAAAER
jgi:hypothetical protein